MRIWNVLILSSLFGLASLFATPPAPSPAPMPVPEPVSSATDKPAELRGRLTFSETRRDEAGVRELLRIEVSPNGECTTIRQGNEARMRLGPTAMAELTALLDDTPTYLGPARDFESQINPGSHIRNVDFEQQLLYPDSQKLLRIGNVSNDVPRRVRALLNWLGSIEMQR
ncbi:MAG: hypothetical protein SF069_13100 [Phycisphaerae bacterium]|nr:hypothetical protein [Phycisphaerae bacterium]